MKKTVFLLYIIIALQIFPASASLIIDSLLVKLPQTQGEEKVDILNLIAMELVNKEKEKSIEYVQKALALSEEIEYDFGIAKAYTVLGSINKGDLDVSFEYLSKALLIFNKLGIDKERIRIIHFIGNIYFNHSDYPKALKYYINTIKIAEKIDNKMYKGSSIQNIGSIYCFQKKYKQSIAKYKEALGLYRGVNYLRGIAGCNTNIGWVYYQEGNYYEALKWYKKNKIVHQEMLLEDGKRGKGRDDFISFDKLLIGNSLNNIGEVYRGLGDYDLALENHWEAIALHNSNGFDSLLSNNGSGAVLLEAYKNISSVYIQKKDNEKALKYSLIALELCDPIEEHKAAMEIYLQLSQIYDTIGNFQIGYAYYKKYIAVKDSTFNNEKEKEIENLNFGYEAEKTEQEIAKLEQENIKNEQKKTALLVIVILLIIISSVVILIQRSKKKNMIELMQKRKEAHQSNKLLMEMQLKNTKLEQEELQDKIGLRNRELVNFALHIVQKNNILTVIKKETGRLQRMAVSPETLSIVNELSILIYQLLNIEKDQSDFKNHIKDINDSFFINLKERFPDLTKTEMRLSSLLRLDLSSKDISTILNITIKGVEMNRYRLRKKLGIKSDDDISKFLSEIDNPIM